MDNFKRNKSNKFGGRRSRGGRDSGRSSMHKAVCSDCGKDCEVPFRPTGDKSVFCSDCFRNRGNAQSKRLSFGDKRMHKAVCSDCGKDCEVPFKPTGDKPIYCNQCFDRGGKSKASSQLSKQLEIINAKLDRILEALSFTIPTKADQKKKIIKKTAISKPKKIIKKKDKKTVSSKKPKVKPKAKAKKRENE
ncbi:CxxC-x17-CxxC domain-containing protein [Patescibacteria group bacterium]